MIRLRVSVGALLLPALSACGEREPPATPDVPVAERIGDPLPGLLPDELRRFREGHALFRRVFTPEEGMGPLFNENACNACHTDPADGGTGDQFLVRASAVRPDGSCDPLLHRGGDNLRQRAVPSAMALGIARDEVPAEATVTGRFNVPFLFGLGLVEAIPEEAILAREDPEDRNGDGIRGRAPRDAEGRVARFGRKGTSATLDAFTEEALRLEMGLGTPLHPDPIGPNRGPLPPGLGIPPGPHVTQEEMDRITDFVRFLSPPPRTLPEDPGLRGLVERGEVLFHEVGCTGCHTPWMETGPHPVAALDRKRIGLYSNLLLHDLGDALASVCSEVAGPREVRTQPLMGLHHRRRYLHDSRAASLWEAIALHDGEARGVRSRFEALDRMEQEAVIRFLGSL